ncbi:MAG: M3 family metallopeptidase [Flavonifractor plautii]
MFAEFELRIGQLAAQGETLTADLLSREYRALNEDYFGPDMVIDDEIALEWARIPHFYYNYYVFQYATGYSAAIALSRRILKEGAPAVKDYLGFLSGGCSQDPIDLPVGPAWIWSSPAHLSFWTCSASLDEMEELTCRTNQHTETKTRFPVCMAAYGEARFGLM